jgi:DnaJ-class molecular chaperone
MNMKMPSVDPIEIMLSEIFDKVFYNKHQGPRAEVCEDCDGVGWVEAEFVRPQNFDRDVGYLDTKRVDCEECGGTGFMEEE